MKLTPRHYAYLKISEGCNHRCTFCIIPSMRGDLVSRPIGEVLAEAKRLADAGVKELLVISRGYLRLRRGCEAPFRFPQRRAGENQHGRPVRTAR